MTDNLPIVFVFSETLSPYYQEIKEQINSMETQSPVAEFLRIEFSMWELPSTEPRHLLEPVDRVIDICNRYRNRNDKFGNDIRAIAVEVLYNYLKFIDFYFLNYNKKEAQNNKEIFKRTIQLIQKTAAVFHQYDRDNISIHQKIMKSAGAVLQHVDADTFVRDISSIIRQIKKNGDFKEFIRSVIKKVNDNKQLFGDSKFLQGTIDNYQNWLDKKDRNQLILTIAATVATVGVAWIFRDSIKDLPENHDKS